jgi:hypothetical protein
VTFQQGVLATHTYLFLLSLLLYSPSVQGNVLAMSEGIELHSIGRSAPTPPPRQSDSAAGGLGRAYRLAEEKAKAAVHLQEGGLDATSSWGLGAAAW